MTKSRHAHMRNQRGSLVVSILIVTVFLVTVISGLLVLANSNLARAKSRIYMLQAQYAAESAADAAIASLNADETASYTGTGSTEVQILSNNQYRSTYMSTISAGATAHEKIISTTGKVYQPKNATVAKYTYKVEVIAQRSASSVVINGMLSRNIIEFASSVKDVYARDLYVNSYIWMNKNTTKLHAENIVVAGKNTGAANCSIGGVGNLVKPTTFTDPSQTKTNITMSYNNCISPPGNTSNTDFNVLANQTTLGKISSTYVPWSQYMDNSYQNSPGGCNDWTTGSSPRDIPSTGNTKKTHYPDSGSNVSASCGASGDLALGTNTYNIRDHTHVRAGLCVSAACAPTFNNPDSTVKYVFIEGTVNFDSVTTQTGSGPIVLVTYGADPASKTSVCPLGGAMYLGNGDVNAPAMYFLAINGLCFDKTKFTASPSFGGISGKNIYISTNPGTPFDPQLNTTFPFGDVPIDLSWHANHYRRVQ